MSATQESEWKLRASETWLAGSNYLDGDLPIRKFHLGENGDSKLWLFLDKELKSSWLPRASPKCQSGQICLEMARRGVGILLKERLLSLK